VERFAFFKGIPMARIAEPRPLFGHPELVTGAAIGGSSQPTVKRPTQQGGSRIPDMGGREAQWVARDA
jgi:hypothetical protein